MSGIVGILLAAGSAQRFGAPKLLHPLDDGTPLGIAAAQTLMRALPDTIAVVRAGDHALRDAFVAIGLSVVENPAAERGMGGSLAAGVKAAAGAGGWIIALADMPWVQASTIRALAARLSGGASIVAPLHAGRRGHPVGFAPRWGARLAALDGDQGARGLIATHPQALVLHPTDDPGVLRDVDRRTDLLRGD